MRIGSGPTCIIGLGRYSVISLSRVPRPPHRIKTGILPICTCIPRYVGWLAAFLTQQPIYGADDTKTFRRIPPRLQGLQGCRPLWPAARLCDVEPEIEDRGTVGDPA